MYISWGKVALDGLLSDSKKLVFRPEDFKEFPDVVQESCKLGIISRTTVEGPSVHASQNNAEKSSIEFYHKLAQEHAAGKYIASKTTKMKMKLQVSKLARIIDHKKSPRACILKYEDLLRFASGTKSEVCLKIINEILANDQLDVSEKSRIILDCSCESPGLEGNVSSVIRGCFAKGSIVLRSPTIFTVAGIKKLPETLKKEVIMQEINTSTKLMME